MNQKREFMNWLRENTSLSASTIGKYARAVNTISEEFGYRLGLGGNMISKCIAIPEFDQKDVKGHRMYSNALRYYYNFVKTKYS